MNTAPRWCLVVHWCWGSQVRFQEKTEHVFPEEPAEDQVRRQVWVIWKKIKKRYRFDCGDKSRPLCPLIAGVEVCRVTPLRTFKIDLSKFRCDDLPE
jgi:hypothetical protein